MTRCRTSRFLSVATLVALSTVLALSCGTEKELASPVGTWRATLASPGGELPFGLVVGYAPESNGDLRASIVNGSEEIEIGAVEFDGATLHLELRPYDSRIVAKLSDGGQSMAGTWTKAAGPGKSSQLAFSATLGPAARFASIAAESTDDPSAILRGRWAVVFSSDDLPAVATFEPGLGTSIHGTFLTATGDYRYLDGSFESERLRLSTFDGAHAFLFDATLQPDGGLSGDFWSRDSWHETWTARPDPDAEAPDPFFQTRWTGHDGFGDAAYPDLDGRMRRLDDPAFDGKARLLVVFGTWCPNCNDATDLLVELDRRYRGRGLSILGLAFELTGDAAEDTTQVRRYSEHHGMEYPVLLAGTSEKADASRAFPLVDRVRAFPTIVFLTGTGDVRAVYSGFSGPATGPAYDRLRKDFVDLIEDLLS